MNKLCNVHAEKDTSEKRTKKTKTLFIFLPFLMLEFKFTLFNKNVPNVVKNFKENSDLV